jgi:hypothetical protein
MFRATMSDKWFLLCCSDMIHEFTAITNSFVSVPADMGHFNCASFLAGIIAGVLDSAKFVSFAPHCLRNPQDSA